MTTFQKIEDSKFNPEPYWTKPIPDSIHVDPLDFKYVDLFDQNGYDLSEIEKLYCVANYVDESSSKYDNHRAHRFAIKKPWYVQTPRQMEGPVINHCYLFERKGYDGKALEQLKSYAKINPLFYKVIGLRPKWGIDFSLDFVGTDKLEGSAGEADVFEIFHYEWDSFTFEDVNQMKEKVEKVIESTDWNAAAKELLARRDEWQNLPFFEQSDWKCRFFGLPSEKFKMVVW